MFRSRIQSTVFTSDVAESCFQNIRGENFHDDCSFISTLRALVAPRIGSDELYLQFNATDYTRTTLEENNKRTLLGVARVPDDDENGIITIHSFRNGNQDNNLAWIEFMENNFEEAHSGWHRLDKVTDFYRKSFNVLCFINPTNKCVMIFIDNMDLRKMHYLQCSIFAFLPWYFNPNDGVSEQEMALINSLREKNSENYINCLTELAKNYDFRGVKIRNLLSGFEAKFETQELERVERQLRQINDHLIALNGQLDSKLREKTETEIKHLGLITKINQGSEESEIMDYFLCNKKLNLISVRGTEMTFVVSDYLTYFDEDMAETMLNNKASYIYKPNRRDCSDIISQHDIEKLMRAVFIDNTVKIRFCAAYSFNIGGNIHTQGGFGFGSEFNTSMPNPHIDRYNCLGNYERTINTLLTENNYIGAIEQCIASCKSLNFGDGVVMDEFMSQIYKTNGRQKNTNCFEMPDGSITDAFGAIKWLNQEGK